MIAQEVVEERSDTFDASKTPRSIDFTMKTGQDAGKTQLGIDKLDGDKLTLVLTEAGSTTRPKPFQAEAGYSLIEGS